MPTITIDDETIECEKGRTLLRVLPDDVVSSTPLTLCGNGICGLCTVELEGEVSEPTEKELTRLSAYAEDGRLERRLACQTEVLGDLEIRTNGKGTSDE